MPSTGWMAAKDRCLRLRNDATVSRTPLTRACLPLVAVLSLTGADFARADEAAQATEVTQPVLVACPAPDESRAELWHGEHIWQALQREGYVIGHIDIVVDDVFDLANPGEDTWYGRAADA